jgi:phosphate transport system permease protein
MPLAPYSQQAASTQQATPGGSVVARSMRGRVRDACRAGLPLRWAGGVGAVIPLLALVFVLGTLIIEALPAIRVNGLHFFTATDWDQGNLYGDAVVTDGVAHPAGAYYGALPLIVGTLASSAVALIIAVPVSIGAAFAIVERLPKRLASTVGMVIELLAGIPSVVVGLWGAMTFGPFIAHYVAPVIARNAPDVPVFDYFRGDTGHGEGLLVSGLVLAVMIIPIVASTTRDLIRQVPLLPREGATALGMSDWECARRVTLPWVSSGIIGAVVLGLGRALGETMAVAMVSGAELGALPGNIYSTMTTIAATIVSQLDSALTDSTGFAVKTLAEASLVLMVITLLTNVAARALVRRVSGTALPVGRGI